MRKIINTALDASICIAAAIGIVAVVTSGLDKLYQKETTIIESHNKSFNTGVELGWRAARLEMLKSRKVKMDDILELDTIPAEYFYNLDSMSVKID